MVVIVTASWGQTWVHDLIGLEANKYTYHVNTKCRQTCWYSNDAWCLQLFSPQSTLQSLDNDKCPGDHVVNGWNRLFINRQHNRMNLRTMRNFQFHPLIQTQACRYHRYLWTSNLWFLLLQYDGQNRMCSSGEISSEASKIERIVKLCRHGGRAEIKFRGTCGGLVSISPSKLTTLALRKPLPLEIEYPL